MFSSISAKHVGLFVAVIVALFLAVYSAWYLVTFTETTTPIQEPTEIEDDSLETSDQSLPISDERTGTSSSSDVLDSLATSIADDNDDFGACNADAQLYCSGFSSGDWVSWASARGYVTASWKLGLVDCLGQNREQTSQACRDSLDRRQVLNEDVNTLCRTDRATYCAGVVPIPGSEPQVDCLMEHYSQVSASCAAALDAHEAAKPMQE